jgi:HK97 family phage portal protein
MSLRDRIMSSAVETRVIGGVPWRPWDSFLWRFDTGGPTHPSRQFMGADAALALPALYGGVKLLADNIASMPLRVYLSQLGRDGYPGKRMWTGPSIFDQPSVIGTTYSWINTMMVSVLLQGNAWGWITGRDSYGFPTGIEWIPPHDVYVHEQEDEHSWNPLRARVFAFGREVRWFGPDAEVFHVAGLPMPGRVEGISPLRQFALTFLAGTEAQRYGTDWYASGGFPPGTFQNAEIEVDKQQAAEMRAELVKSLRRREPLVYGRDWDYKPVTVPPSEAQFLETMQMNATHVAVILNLPPDRIGGSRGDSLTYNCVDSETEILTTRGWLHHDQVTTSDTALTLNTETGAAEWQQVKSVHVFDDGPYPVTRWESRSHSSVTTPNHRWPVMIKGRKNGLRAGYRWLTTETAPTDSHIAAAAPVVAPTEAKWSDALTELVAWFWTEGWHNEYGSVVIAQSETANPQNVVRIRQALTEVFGPSGERQVRAVPSWREDHGDNAVHFRLNAKAGRQLLAHAPGKVVTTEFLSQLTRAQLELFYQVSIDADGTRRPGDRGDVIGQKDRTRLEAFQVAVSLTGRAGVICGPNSRGMYHMSVKVTPWVKPKGHAQYVSDGETALVWCVQTPNRSWFARRNGTCYFTGNTTEQSTLQIIEACRPWLVNAEQRFSNLLLPRNRMCKFFTDALLKTDLEARMNIYLMMRNIGLRSINELRDLEDLPPIPGDIGNEYLPLTTMNALGTRAGVIPKSFMKSVVLEMDVATDRLIRLEKYIIPQLVKQGYPVQGVAPAPGAGGSGSSGGSGAAPGKSSPSAGGSSLSGAPGTPPSPYPITVNGQTGTPIGRPNAPLPLAQDPASFLASLISVQRDANMPYEVRIAAQEMLVSICEREDRIRREEPDAGDEQVPASHMFAPFTPGRADVREMVMSTNGKGRGNL